jgi:hypothetical protein
MGADTLDAQLGFGVESVYGTAVTPTRWIEFLSDTVKKDKTRILSRGLRAGGSKVQPRGARTGSIRASGDIEAEIQTKAMGLYFKHLFGAVAVTQPDAGGNPTVYDQTFTPAGVAGLSGTLESAFLDDDGNPHRKTISGAKLATGEFSFKANELAQVKFGINAQNIVTGDAKTAATYASGFTQFGSADIALSLGGTPILAEDATVTFNNQLDSKDYLGNSGLQDAPKTLERLGIEASVAAPWQSWTDYARLDSDAEAQLIITCTGPVISGMFNFMLRLTMKVRTDGETPSIGGRERINQPLKFTAVGDTPGEACTLLYRTTDTTP